MPPSSACGPWPAARRPLAGIVQALAQRVHQIDHVAGVALLTAGAPGSAIYEMGSDDQFARQKLEI
jgi:hypothetical protein